MVIYLQADPIKRWETHLLSVRKPFLTDDFDILELMVQIFQEPGKEILNSHYSQHFFQFFSSLTSFFFSSSSKFEISCQKIKNKGAQTTDSPKK